MGLRDIKIIDYSEFIDSVGEVIKRYCEINKNSMYIHYNNWPVKQIKCYKDHDLKVHVTLVHGNMQFSVCSDSHEYDDLINLIVSSVECICYTIQYNFWRFSEKFGYIHAEQFIIIPTDIVYFGIELDVYSKHDQSYLMKLTTKTGDNNWNIININPYNLNLAIEFIQSVYDESIKIVKTRFPSLNILCDGGDIRFLSIFNKNGIFYQESVFRPQFLD